MAYRLNLVHGTSTNGRAALLATPAVSKCCYVPLLSNLGDMSIKSQGPTCLLPSVPLPDATYRYKMRRKLELGIRADFRRVVSQEAHRISAVIAALATRLSLVTASSWPAGQYGAPHAEQRCTVWRGPRSISTMVARSGFQRREPKMRGRNDHLFNAWNEWAEPIRSAQHRLRPGLIGGSRPSWRGQHR
jgi:hypothetical protein